MTIQPTETILETVLAGLDFEPDVECDHHQCAAKARWYCTHNCCRLTYPLCGQHRAQVLTYIATHPEAVCKSCDADCQGVRFEPIKPA